ncbi:CpaF family protein [Bdellovibrio reynosensis]|uniref:Flp pilus assembly complex ATPase component TadA n=1 Tax=Bdellovibrio reynosensis TaxID=2835041 RepID=A0ABY4CFH2_9BACT|nr:ATPase, T2SS/T4P/T4SS family [Bdellovibrio reynosensis]UOF00955.1 Flp pilus assembly complex ATPase component TadA [Bdellovibrio reynosensis]
MNQTAAELYSLIQEDIQKIPYNEFLLTPDEQNNLRSQKVDHIFRQRTADTDPVSQKRILAEYYSWGPLEDLIDDESITEIIINGPGSIWLEKQGRLQPHGDFFFSDLSYRNFIERLCQHAQVHITKEHPSADGNFKNFRLSLIGEDLTHCDVHLSLRRHPKNPWNFEKLNAKGWCSSSSVDFFKSLIENRKNFLVIGPTGAGKTSVLNSFLKLLPENERAVVLEDTSEIVLPNSASMKLLTRDDPHGILPNIDQNHLVKKALRLRPDRIIMGEIRGAEAKDFLMAMATGHAGSFGTLHAQDAGQALIRLEMLIQMGAPQWSLTAIRRLIQLSIDYIIVTGKLPSGERTFKGAYRLCSLEEHGFLLEPEEL